MDIYTIETTPFVQWQPRSLCFLRQNKNLWSKILLVCWSCDPEQTSIWHQDFTVDNLIQASAQNPFVKHALLVSKFSSCLLHLLQVEYPGLAIFSLLPSLRSPIFVIFDHCCWLLYCCWLPSRALLSSLLLSCFTQCYCEELRAQTRWGALEVFFLLLLLLLKWEGTQTSEVCHLERYGVYFLINFSKVIYIRCTCLSTSHICFKLLVKASSVGLSLFGLHLYTKNCDRKRIKSKPSSVVVFFAMSEKMSMGLIEHLAQLKLFSFKHTSNLTHKAGCACTNSKVRHGVFFWQAKIAYFVLDHSHVLHTTILQRIFF